MADVAKKVWNGVSAPFKDGGALHKMWGATWFKVVFSLLVVCIFIVMCVLASTVAKCNSALSQCQGALAQCNLSLTQAQSATPTTTSAQVEQSAQNVLGGLQSAGQSIWSWFSGGSQPATTVVVVPTAPASGSTASTGSTGSTGTTGTTVLSRDSKFNHFSQSSTYPGAESFCLSNSVLDAHLTPVEYNSESMHNPTAEHMGNSSDPNNPYAQNSIYQSNGVGITSTTSTGVYQAMAGSVPGSVSMSF